MAQWRDVSTPVGSSLAILTRVLSAALELIVPRRVVEAFRKGLVGGAKRECVVVGHGAVEIALASVCETRILR